MTTVIESQRKAGGRRRVPAVTTPSLSQPSAVPLLPPLLLQHPTEAFDGGGGEDLWQTCAPACSLSFLHVASSSLGSSVLPAMVSTSVALGSSQNLPQLATTSQFPGKPLIARASQEANIFVSSGTGLQEPGFSFIDTSPSSPRAGPARCSAISQHSWSRPV